MAGACGKWVGVVPIAQHWERRTVWKWQDVLYKANLFEVHWEIEKNTVICFTK